MICSQKEYCRIKVWLLGVHAVLLCFCIFRKGFAIFDLLTLCFLMLLIIAVFALNGEGLVIALGNIRIWKALSATHYPDRTIHQCALKSCTQRLSISQSNTCWFKSWSDQHNRDCIRQITSHYLKVQTTFIFFPFCKQPYSSLICNNRQP